MNGALLNTMMFLLVLSSIQSARASGHENHANHSGHDHTRPDSHAPIGVMGVHLMRPGEVMLSYRYMSMAMDGNRTGTDSVNTPLPGYMVSPLSMDMDMHMFTAMYAPSRKLTMMVTLPYASVSMDHLVNMSGANFTTESAGVGDVKLGQLTACSPAPAQIFCLTLSSACRPARSTSRITPRVRLRCNCRIRCNWVPVPGTSPPA